MIQQHILTEHIGDVRAQLPVRHVVRFFDIVDRRLAKIHTFAADIHNSRHTGCEGGCPFVRIGLPVVAGLGIQGYRPPATEPTKIPTSAQQYIRKISIYIRDSTSNIFTNIVTSMSDDFDNLD
jgi:hypothetical protein